MNLSVSKFNKSLQYMGRNARYAIPALAVLTVLCLVNALIDPSVMSPGNWPSVAATLAPFVLIAMAQAPAVIAGGAGLDLSVGPTAGVVNVFIVAILVGNGITSPVVILASVFAIGIVVGLTNGLLVSVIRIPPIIATLGTYLFLGGLALVLQPTAGGRAPDWLIALGRTTYILPGSIWLILLGALPWLILISTRFRQNLLATGGDARAAYSAGTNVTAVRLTAYILSGFTAAVAGLAFCAALGSADPLVGPHYTLISITGMALGGVALAGGRGGLIGAGAGGAILYVTQNILGAAHVETSFVQVFYGLILIIALGIGSLTEARRRSDRYTLKTA